MKLFLSLGAIACLAFSQSVPNPNYAPIPTLGYEPAQIQSTREQKTMLNKAYGYASGQADKMGKSVSKIFKKKQKTQLTASQYPFYTVQSASVVNPGESQFKSPMLKVIQ